MDIISAYRDVGTFRGAAVVCGTTDKTVKRVIARHEAGESAPERVPRERNYDLVVELVAEKVNKTAGRISAKRLLPAARAAGYVVHRATSAGWWPSGNGCGATSTIAAAARRCGPRVSTW